MNFFTANHCLSGTECRRCRDKTDGLAWRHEVLKAFSHLRKPDFLCRHGKPWGYIPPVLPQNRPDSLRSEGETGGVVDRIKQTDPTPIVSQNGTIHPVGPIVVVPDYLRKLDLHGLEGIIMGLEPPLRAEGIEFLRKEKEIADQPGCGGCKKDKCEARIRVWIAQHVTKEKQHGSLSEIH